MMNRIMKLVLAELQFSARKNLYAENENRTHYKSQLVKEIVLGEVKVYWTKLFFVRSNDSISKDYYEWFRKINLLE